MWLTLSDTAELAELAESLSIADMAKQKWGHSSVLAGNEMHIGRFYQQRRLYPAAINRFRRVVDEYQTTNHVPEALHRLTEIYLAMGLPEEAVRSLFKDSPPDAYLRKPVRLADITATVERLLIPVGA